jgi:hypothetical protein
MKFIMSRSHLTIEIEPHDAGFSNVDTTGFSHEDLKAIQSVFIKLHSAQTDVGLILPVLKTLTKIASLTINVEGVIRRTYSKDFLKTSIMGRVLACPNLKTLDLSQIRIEVNLSNKLMSQLSISQGNKLTLIAPLWTEVKTKAKEIASVTESGVLVFAEDFIDNFEGDSMVDADWVVPRTLTPAPPVARRVPASGPA